MTDKEIVMAAKTAEKKTEFGELVHSKVSRGVNSAYGIGFLEGAEWTREQMLKGAVEGEVYKFGEVAYVKECNNAELTKYLSQFNNGDKVKIIVINETDIR